MSTKYKKQQGKKGLAPCGPHSLEEEDGIDLYFQDFLHTGGPVSLSQVVNVRCQRSGCGRLMEIEGAYEIGIEDGITEIQDSVTAAMDSDGWRRGNCPECVNDYPELAKSDRDEYQADYANDCEEGLG